MVSDSRTGLQWQDNNDSSSTQRTWQNAIDYCEALSLDTHTDWRLPNVNELKTLLDRSKVNPSIKENVFEYLSSSSYWSSTSVVGGENYAWFVFFVNGYVYRDGKATSGYVRCVRDGQ